MKIQFLVAGASLLFVCGLVLSISDDRYVADAAIEIGVGGFHRELSLSEPVDLINDFGRQIEAVEDLLYILDVKYGIERGKRPRLVHRIAKTQRIQYEWAVGGRDCRWSDVKWYLQFYMEWHKCD